MKYTDNNSSTEDFLYNNSRLFARTAMVISVIDTACSACYIGDTEIPQVVKDSVYHLLCGGYRFGISIDNENVIVEIYDSRQQLITQDNVDDSMRSWYDSLFDWVNSLKL